MRLIRTSDEVPGLSRKKRGASFVYLDIKKRVIRDPDTLARIRRLAIPPAYEKIWICPNPNGHLQATGIDQRGRKQYRYHPEWTKKQDLEKYERMVDFAKTLPQMRARIKHDLKLRGLPRQKVLAAIVTLLEKTLIRVGNESYARDNQSYGLTTLRSRHAKVSGSKIHFDFTGKSGVHHILDLNDARLAHIVRQCEALPGKEIFKYTDAEGNLHDVRAEHVNAYLKEVSRGHDFTAKDFRTWAGTLLAAEALRDYESFTSQREAKKQILKAVESVAGRLGNTKAVCRKCYIHPDIFAAHMDGSLAEIFRDKAASLLAKNYRKLPRDEAMILVLLEKGLGKKTRPSRSA